MPRRFADAAERVAAGRIEDSVREIEGGLVDVGNRLGQIPINVPCVVNRYYMNGSFLAGGGGRGGNVGITRAGVELKSCVAYRAWVNDTGAAQNRSIGVFPSSGTFPVNGRVTVFVAVASHTGPPPAGSNPTTIDGSSGDIVSKTVPDKRAVFVHFQGRANQKTDADISEEP